MAFSAISYQPSAISHQLSAISYQLSAMGIVYSARPSVVGSYHQLSEKHLDAYLDEFEWRFNNRENDFLFRDTLMALLSAETLPYEELVSPQ
jgi:hypothetical protein